MSKVDGEVDAFFFLMCGGAERRIVASDIAKLLLALHTMAGRRDFLQYAGMRQEAAAIVEAHHIAVEPLIEAHVIKRIVDAKIRRALPRGRSMARDFVHSLFHEDKNMSQTRGAEGPLSPMSVIGASLTASNHCLMVMSQELGLDHAGQASITDVVAWCMRSLTSCTVLGRQQFFEPSKDVEYGINRINSAIANSNSLSLWLSTEKKTEEHVFLDLPVLNVDFLSGGEEASVQLHKRRWLHPCSHSISTPSAMLTSAASGFGDEQIVLSARPRESVQASAAPTVSHFMLAANETQEPLKVPTYRTSHADPSWAVANRAAAFYCCRHKSAAVDSFDTQQHSPRSAWLADEVFDFICTHNAFFVSIDQTEEDASSVFTGEEERPRRWNVTLSALSNFFSVLCLPRLDGNLSAMLASPTLMDPGDRVMNQFLTTSAGSENLSVRRFLDCDFLRCLFGPLLSSSDEEAESENCSKSSFRMLFNEDDVFSSSCRGGAVAGKCNNTVLLSGSALSLSQDESGRDLLSQPPRIRSFSVPFLKDQGAATLVNCQQYRLGLSASQAMSIVAAWKMVECLHTEPRSAIRKVVGAVRLHLSCSPSFSQLEPASSVLKHGTHHLCAVASTTTANYASDHIKKKEEEQRLHNAVIRDAELASPIDKALLEDEKATKQRKSSSKNLTFRTANLVESCSALALLNHSESSLIRIPDVTAVNISYFLPRDLMDVISVQSTLRSVHFVLPNTKPILPRPQAQRAAGAEARKLHAALHRAVDLPEGPRLAGNKQLASRRRGIRLSDAAVTQVIARYAQLGRASLHALVGGLVTQTALRAPPVTALFKSVPKTTAPSPPIISPHNVGAFLPLAATPPKGTGSTAAAVVAATLEPQPLPVASLYLSPSFCSIVRRAWMFASFVRKDLLPDVLAEIEAIEGEFLSARTLSFKKSHEVAEVTAFADRSAFERRRELLRSIHNNTKMLTELAAAKIGFDIPNFDLVGKRILTSTSIVEQQAVEGTAAAGKKASRSDTGDARGKDKTSRLVELHEQMTRLQDLKRQRSDLDTQLRGLEAFVAATAEVKEQTLAIRRSLLESLEAKKAAFRRSSQETHTKQQLDID
jgi:hypothetical protein